MSWSRQLFGHLGMYQVAIVYLVTLWLMAAVLARLGLSSHSPEVILTSGLCLVVLSALIDQFLAYWSKTTANPESAVITGLILALIVGPVGLVDNIFFLSAVSVVAISSKYFLVWRRRHIFNPAAFGVAVSALFFGQGASWWFGPEMLMPVVAVLVIGGLWLLLKAGRLAMAAIFTLSYIVFLTFFNWSGWSDLLALPVSTVNLLTAGPLLFLAIVMVTEPKSSPSRWRWGLVYAVLTALTMVLLQKYTSTPYSFELGLLIGNLLAFCLFPEVKRELTLTGRSSEADRVESFTFRPDRPFAFRAGQYLQITLPHFPGDGRGWRRYLTAASSPTETDVMVAVKMPEKPSRFKRALSSLPLGGQITATGPAGDFVLPKEQSKKLVFIAGGIGVTPFRSMVKYLADEKQERDVHLLYAVESSEDLSFTDIFELTPGVKTTYLVKKSMNSSLPSNEVGQIDKEKVSRLVPDWSSRWFYVSGPEPMVRSVIRELRSLGVSRHRIKRDYFSGYESI